MKVMDVMQKKVFTVTPNDKVDRVFFLVHYEHIRHLPVVEGDRVVGIVSDRDLYKALGHKSNTRAIVEQKNDAIMSVSSKKFATSCEEESLPSIPKLQSRRLLSF